MMTPTTRDVKVSETYAQCGMPRARSVLASVGAVLLCSLAMGAVVQRDSRVGRAALEGDNDFSTGDRTMNWGIDGPTKAVRIDPNPIQQQA